MYNVFRRTPVVDNSTCNVLAATPKATLVHTLTIRTGVKILAVFKEHTVIVKRKAFWSKVGYNIASFSIGTQLFAKLDIFYFSHRLNEVNIMSHTRLVLFLTSVQRP